VRLVTAERDTRQPPRSWSEAWLLLLGGCCVAVTLGDIALLREATGYLTSGFNSAHLEGANEIAAFFAASLTLDLALVLAIWAVILPLLERLRLSPLQCFCVAGALGMGAPLAVSAARYNVYAIAGNAFRVPLLDPPGGATSSSVAVEVLDEAHIVLAVALPVVGVVVARSV
jgi:hypothetical protein